MKKLFSAFILVCLTSMQLWAQQLVSPRAPAEWEEVRGVVMEVKFYQGHMTIPFSEAIDPYIKVAQACINENIDLYCITGDTIIMGGTVRAFNLDTVFSNRGIVSPRIHKLQVTGILGTNAPWTRDHGMFGVYENETGALKLADFGASEFSQNLIANTLGISAINIPPSYSTDVSYYDGGNWLCDGHHTFNIANIGTGISPGLVQPAKPDVADYLGISKTLNVTGVSVHTDYWLKMLNEETFVVSYIPQSNYGSSTALDPKRDHQNDIDASVALIKQQLTSAFGRPFMFHQIQNAPSYDNSAINTTYSTADASYTNSLILNKTVLVPQYGVQPFDQNALDAYAALMPGYTITGVNYRQYVASGGAMHCITHEIYAQDPIYMKHAWLKDTIDFAPQYPITAMAKSQSGISAIKLYWKTASSTTWNEVAMTGTGPEYAAVIPGHPVGATLEYYISASNNLGKTISKPMVAPAGVYKSYIRTATGIGDLAREANGVVLYPSPANEYLQLQLTNWKLANTEVQIQDNSGRTLLHLPAKTSMRINTGNLSSGIYYLRYGSTIRKFVVQH